MAIILSLMQRVIIYILQIESPLLTTTSLTFHSAFFGALKILLRFPIHILDFSPPTHHLDIPLPCLLLTKIAQPDLLTFCLPSGEPFFIPLYN